MAEFSEDDFRWLVSEKAIPHLELAAGSTSELVALTSKLRKEISAARTHLVLEQCELRRRAGVKFPLAEKMFFTRTLLEQATEQQIASYKAQRLRPNMRFADLCCGLGGDLLGWATRGACQGVDRDPIAALLAVANCQVNGITSAEMILANAVGFPVAEFDAWHIDPDRRPLGQRTTQLSRYVPPLETLEVLLDRQPNAALKLAPGTPVLDHWQDRAEFEWIGSRRECRQQVAWFGELAQQPGKRRATVLSAEGRSSSISGTPDDEAPTTERIGRYFFEPHAAVIAARLINAVCLQRELIAVSAGYGYLTADHPCADPLVSSFEVLDVVPFDVQRLRAEMRERKIGRLEIKARGVDIDPAQLRKVLLKKPFGDNPLTILVVGPEKHPRTVLAQRPAGQ